MQIVRKLTICKKCKCPVYIFRGWNSKYFKNILLLIVVFGRPGVNPPADNEKLVYLRSVSLHQWQSGISTKSLLIGWFLCQVLIRINSRDPNSSCRSLTKRISGRFISITVQLIQLLSIDNVPNLTAVVSESVPDEQNFYMLHRATIVLQNNFHRPKRTIRANNHWDMFCL